MATLSLYSIYIYYCPVCDYDFHASTSKTCRCGRSLDRMVMARDVGIRRAMLWGGPNPYQRTIRG